MLGASPSAGTARTQAAQASLELEERKGIFNDLKGEPDHVGRMQSKFPRWVEWPAMIVAAYNVEKAADLLKIDSILAWLLQSVPEVTAAASEVLSNKWVFGLSTFILGMAFADRVVRASLRMETEPGFKADWLLTVKKFAAIRALRGTRPFTWFVDLSHEINTLDAALRGPHRNMPPLPCTDLSDADGMLLTRRYLEAVGPIRARHLDEARARAKAILEAARPPAPASAPPGWRRRVRRTALALLSD